MMGKNSNFREFNYTRLVLSIIILLGAFFRLYDFTNRISTGSDSARDAFVSLVGANTLQIPLTGPFISIAPVTNGPWYWIQLILARLFIPSSYAPWILIATYSILMMYVMFLIGREVEGEKLGLILALITAFSSQQIDTAIQLTNPSVVGFFSSIVVLLFIRILKSKENPMMGFLLGIALGLTISAHYQSVGLVSLVLTLLIFRNRYFRTLGYFFAGIGVTFIPLLIFELNNHWYNTRHMLNYFLYDQYRIYVPMSWKIFLKDLWPNYISFVFGFPKIIGLVGSVTITVIFMVMVYLRKLPKVFYLLMFSFFVEIIILRYYRGERFFGYLQFFHPFVFLFLGYAVFRLSKLKYGNIFLVLFFSVYLFLTTKNAFSKLNPDHLTVEAKNEVLELSTRMPSAAGYKILRCNYSQGRQEITALVLRLYMDGKYSSSGKPIAYLWGCELPMVDNGGRQLGIKEFSDKKDLLYPNFGYLYDVSIASSQGLLRNGWVEATPQKMYQSAARWWFDEQP